MPARRHLEWQHAADVVVVRHDVDHPEGAAEIGEAHVPAVRAAFLNEAERLRRVDRHDADGAGAGVDKPWCVPVRPDLDDAVARDELEVLPAAAARDLLIVRALIQDTHAAR